MRTQGRLTDAPTVCTFREVNPIAYAIALLAACTDPTPTPSPDAEPVPVEPGPTGPSFTCDGHPPVSTDDIGAPCCGVLARTDLAPEKAFPHPVKPSQFREDIYVVYDFYFGTGLIGKTVPGTYFRTSTTTCAFAECLQFCIRP